MSDIPIIGAKQDKPFDYCLVAPYLDPDPDVRQARASIATATAAHIMAEAGGALFIICPITYIHNMCLHPVIRAMPPLLDYFATVLMDLSDGIIVLELEGWESAPDVQGPIARAKARGMEIVHHKPAPKFTAQSKRIRKARIVGPRN